MVTLSESKSPGFGWMTFGLTAAAVTSISFFVTVRGSMRWLHKLQQRENKEKNMIPVVKKINSNLRNSKYLSNNQLCYQEPKFLYLGNVPIEHRLQNTEYRTVDDYWASYRQASVPLAFRTLISATLFSTSLTVGLVGTFAWYFDIKSPDHVVPLFQKWFKPLRDRLQVLCVFLCLF